MTAYPHIAERLFGRAHAIDPGAMRAIMESGVARRIISGADKSVDDKQLGKGIKARRARMAALANGEAVAVGDSFGYGLTRDGIAIVPVRGVLAQRFDWLASLCGWTTYEGLIEVFDAMLNDYRVKGTLLDVESPGGECSSMLDCADVILAARERMPVWSVANSYAASAAYALAGSAEHLMVPRLGQVGSIGAVAVHIDQSAADQAEGLKYTAVYSGARKIDGWDHAPLDPTAKDSLQAHVDHARNLFAQLVGKQGRISSQQALATEAATYSDQDAVDAGLADAVGTFDDALAQLTELAARGPRTSAIAAESSAVLSNRRSLMDDKNKAAAAEAQAKADLETKVKTEADAKVVADAKAQADVKAAAEAAAVTAAAKAAADAKAVAEANAYTIEMITQTLDLCSLAGSPISKANEFIAAKTPLDKVRASLLADKAKASDAGQTVTTAAAPAVNAGWDKAVEDVNKTYGIASKK